MKWPIVILSCLTLNGFICTAQTTDTVSVRDTISIHEAVTVRDTASVSDTTKISDVVVSRRDSVRDSVAVHEPITLRDTVQSKPEKAPVAPEPEVSSMLAHGR